MKRFTSIVLALCLLLSLSMTAFAADRTRSYTFDLTANGSHEISVKTGDVITVMLELKRTDGGSGLMYAMQDEILYNDKYLALQTGGELLYTGCQSNDIALSAGGRAHYLNFVSTSGGASWDSNVTVGTFRLKVTYDGKATTTLKNSNYLVSTADGQDSYRAAANDVTIHINGGSGTGANTGVLNTEAHIAYVSGYPDGTVRPNAPITRAETAQMLYRLLTDEARREYQTDRSAYSDVPAGLWYSTSVATLSSMGVITGYPDGTFRPTANITRAEFATLLSRLSGADSARGSAFSDVSAHWARKAIAAVSAKGWVSGYPDGTFRPNANITRAEAMAMLNRMLGRLPESERDLLPGMSTFSDNMDSGKWYYLYVQEATNGHTYSVKRDGVHETWESLR